MELGQRFQTLRPTPSNMGGKSTPSPPQEGKATLKALLAALQMIRYRQHRQKSLVRRLCQVRKTKTCLLLDEPSSLRQLP